MQNQKERKAQTDAEMETGTLVVESKNEGSSFFDWVWILVSVGSYLFSGFLNADLPAAAALSDLFKHNESFGLAWLGACMLQKSEGLKAKKVKLLQSVDLSGSSGISPEKLFLFLDFLPTSVEELEMDSAFLTGRGGALFARFLKRLQRARLEGTEAMRLKSFTLAAGSIDDSRPPISEGGFFDWTTWELLDRRAAGAALMAEHGIQLGDREGERDTRESEPFEIFPLLLPFLESLRSRGNDMGRCGSRALAQAIRHGHASSLLSLDLGKTNLDKESLEVLCGALREVAVPLKVETLDLSEVIVDESQMSLLCSVLSVSFLPCLRVLLLRNCAYAFHPAINGHMLQRLANTLKERGLPNLETLDLESGSKPVGGRFLRAWGNCLRSGAVPNLQNLNLMFRISYFSPLDKEGVSEFLHSLYAPESPPFLDVSLQLDGLRCLGEEEVKGLAGGKFQSLRFLRLFLRYDEITKFLGELIDSAEHPAFESLELTLEFNGAPQTKEEDAEVFDEGVKFIGAAIEKGRFDCVHKLRLSGNQWEGPDRVDGAVSLFASLSRATLSQLSEFELPRLAVTDVSSPHLAQAVKFGNLSKLRALDLSHEESFGTVGMETFMEGVMERKLKRLAELRMARCSLTDESVIGLADAARACAFKGIRLLNFATNSEVGGWAWQNFGEAIAESEKGVPALQFLNLSGCNARGLGSLFGSAKFNRLQDVILADSQLTDETVRGLAKGVREGSFVELSTLVLRENPAVSSEAWRELFRAIAESRDGLPKLRKLDLSFLKHWLSGLGGIGGVFANKAGGAGAEVLAALTSGKLGSLHEILTFSGPCWGATYTFSLDETALAALGAAVRAGGRFPPFLSGLGFNVIRESEDRPPINFDSFFTDIAESEEGLPACVGVLLLRGGRFGDAALASLGASRGPKLSHLRVLALSECAMDDVLLKKVAEALSAQRCGNLEQLNLEKNRISVEGVSTFFSTLNPGVAIVKVFEDYCKLQPASAPSDIRAAAFRQGLQKYPELYDLVLDLSPPKSNDVEHCKNVILQSSGETEHKRMFTNFLSLFTLSTSNFPNVEKYIEMVKVACREISRLLLQEEIVPVWSGAGDKTDLSTWRVEKKLVPLLNSLIHRQGQLASLVLINSISNSIVHANVESSIAPDMLFNGSR
uniref:Uncharacterized protein n=1 Tax=Chromera velia CCMP2878 TaxID=1169474 RepID=A0A0G4GTY0_9ALVE|eukprot:Cvel_753.t1-p1 / transcript=Cvel_753.t1 / gene=Cvel_753 / organism=Chromera_velia_CCMP2878 / gene_product=hypothetical protein / transcript_product=hypothetical protein / location=Cvel_scaffold23:101981-111879(-) / protein_length=1158 / sequence_SO=supercontig / SO=protein_coding / is_pseudo=false